MCLLTAACTVSWLADLLQEQVGGVGVRNGLSGCHVLLCHRDSRYLNNPREALQHLNAARRHVRWSTPALLTMAEVYLNPESDVNWATDSGADATPQADGDKRESVRAAGTLLKQLKASDTQTSKSKVCVCARLVLQHTNMHMPGLRGAVKGSAVPMPAGSVCLHPNGQQVTG